VAVSFDCFGTLVAADRPDEPWTAVADALAAHDVTVPTGWEAAYRRSHREYDRGAEAALDEHVRLALADCGVEVEPATARTATLDAFDAPVTVRDGARDAIEHAHEYGPVAVCSNCSVPGLVERTLDRAELSVDHLVTSVDCGWRKPHRRIFERTAAVLDVPLDALVHVGDDTRTDGGAERVGATAVLLDDVALSDLPEWFDANQPNAGAGGDRP
jgi:FMN phosphatase YigB (HAD superfamily)